MLYYDRLDIRSSHYAVRKGVVGHEEVARLFVPFCGFGQDNYRR